jgi:riboflavin kinase/FMN adenylyltransferase
MKIPARVEDFETLNGLEDPLYLAIGIFDGVHRGHKAVVAAAVDAAREANGVSAVLTFDPHPSQLFRPESATRLILPIETKVGLLREAGIQVVIGKRFDAKFAAIPAAEFIAHLKQALPRLAGIFVGSNFRFGQRRTGDVDLLKATGRKAGISVISMDRLEHDGETISSTRIRNALETGGIETANALLGYNYGFIGTVISGAGKGREFGFPTLNLPWAPECAPRYGVYLVRARPLGAKLWQPGIANYGVKPTVAADAKPALEIHLLDTTDLDAGSLLEVEWLRFRRGEGKFENIAALKAQIALDLKWAKEL